MTIKKKCPSNEIHPLTLHQTNNQRQRKVCEIEIVFALNFTLCYFHVFIYEVDILLNATGNVPIMKKRKWAVEGNKPISSIMTFIHKYLKMDAEDKLVSFN